MSSDLKIQFVNYMTLQRFSHHTKRSYLTGVKLLAKHFMQSPDTLNNDQIQDYIRYLLEDRKLSWGTCNANLSGIVCFYRHICKWDDAQFQIPPRPRVKKLPTVFSQPEVKRLLAATENLNIGCCCKPFIAQGCGSVNWFALSRSTLKVMLTVTYYARHV